MTTMMRAATVTVTETVTMTAPVVLVAPATGDDGLAKAAVALCTATVVGTITQVLLIEYPGATIGGHGWRWLCGRFGRNSGSDTVGFEAPGSSAGASDASAVQAPSLASARVAVSGSAW